ncbi:MAG: DUF6036 family nucleotidyltransferase [candidate division WOR-3 bacterium]
MSYLPPFFTIIRRLTEENVKFVVVGGVAAIIHGVPRATFDLDVVIEFSKINVKRFNKILDEFNLRPTVPINPLELANPRKRTEWIKKKNAKVINFKDPKGNYALDVLLIYNYSRIRKIEIEIEEIKFYVVDKNTLVKMKREANRDVDIRDIKNLETL